MSDTNPINEPQNNDIEDMSKRRILAGTVAAAAAAMTSGIAVAGGNHHGKAKKHHHHKKTDKSLLTASNECVQTAKACHSHCLMLVAMGDTSIAECMRSVVETASICNSFSELVTLNSDYVKGMAGVCIKACKDCEKLCRKHADKHKECKECADACKVMIKALSALV